MSFVRGSSGFGESPSNYSIATLQRAYRAWQHTKQDYTVKFVCEFYHRLEQIEKSVLKECSAAFATKHHAQNPNPSDYFKKLFELDKINKLQLSQDPVDHTEALRNNPVPFYEFIDPAAYAGHRMPAFVELTRRFAAEQALLREARVTAASSHRAGASTQTSNTHLDNGGLQGETQRAQRTTPRAVYSGSSTHASRPSVYARGAGSYAQTGAVYSEAVGGYPSRSTSYSKRDGTRPHDPALYPQSTGATTLGDDIPQKMYGVPTQTILATSRLLLKYCRTHDISLNKTLDDFKAFVERRNWRYTVANLDHFIKIRMNSIHISYNLVSEE